MRELENNSTVNAVSCAVSPVATLEKLIVDARLFLPSFFLPSFFLQVLLGVLGNELWRLPHILAAMDALRPLSLSLSLSRPPKTRALIRLPPSLSPT
jgi:hypothetical protein